MKENYNSAFVGASIFALYPEIFNQNNIAIGGQVSSEIFFQVYNSDIDFSNLDYVALSSIGNDMLSNMDLTYSYQYMKNTIDLLLEKGVKNIVLIELPKYENNKISQTEDLPLYLDLLKEYNNQNVFMVADTYREQLIENPLDKIHLNEKGSIILKDKIENLLSENDIYHSIISLTGNSLGTRIFSDTGIDSEFLDYLTENSTSWVNAYEKTIEGGYENIIDIVGQYSEETLTKYFL